MDKVLKTTMAQAGWPVALQPEVTPRVLRGSDTEQNDFEQQVVNDEGKALDGALEALVCHSEARFNTISAHS